MPVPVGRGDVQALLAEGAALLDVLDADEFAHAHLPGAVNIPLAELTAECVDGLHPDAPLIVYGACLQDDHGPRASRLLEHYGFSSVHDYEAGKDDWLAFGLPFEGDGTLLVLHLLDPCVCTGADEPAAELRARLDLRGASLAVLVDEGDIVLGTVSRSALAGVEANLAAVALVDLDPVTVRPSTTAEALTRQLAAARQTVALVTTSSGRLLGQVSAARLTGREPLRPVRHERPLAPLAAAG
jgi:rhodanese-related sulfurtransferase